MAGTPPVRRMTPVAAASALAHPWMDDDREQMISRKEPCSPLQEVTYPRGAQGLSHTQPIADGIVPYKLDKRAWIIT